MTFTLGDNHDEEIVTCPVCGSILNYDCNEDGIGVYLVCYVCPGCNNEFYKGCIFGDHAMRKKVVYNFFSLLNGVDGKIAEHLISAFHYCNSLHKEYLKGVTSRLYKPNAAIPKIARIFIFYTYTCE
jgi:hypothetical protein